ncbi:MAG: hypothetical protein V3S24_02420, partial [Candidatus Tectomicrobia bacterium]
MSDDAILNALREVIDPARICTEQETVVFLARDAVHPARLPQQSTAVSPMCVIRPQNTQEVSDIMHLANTHRVP